MTEDMKLWLEDKERHGWVMPMAPWWKRLPIVRHVRHAIHRSRALRFREMTRFAGLGIGGLPQYDKWVLFGIANGLERSK